MRNLKNGFTYIEVLVAMLLLATIFLVIFNVGFFSLRQSQKSFQYTVATIELFNMLERLHANCSFEKREEEKIRWNENIHKQFPFLSGQYTCFSDKCEIFINGKDFFLNLKTYGD